MTMPPSAGDITTSGSSARTAIGQGGAQGLGLARVLQHQRALQIARAVQARGQPEMSFEEGADAAKQVEDLSGGQRSHARLASIPSELARSCDWRPQLAQVQHLLADTTGGAAAGLHVQNICPRRSVLGFSPEKPLIMRKRSVFSGQLPGLAALALTVLTILGTPASVSAQSRPRRAPRLAGVVGAAHPGRDLGQARPRRPRPRRPDRPGG